MAYIAAGKVFALSTSFTLLMGLFVNKFAAEACEKNSEAYFNSNEACENDNASHISHDVAFLVTQSVKPVVVWRCLRDAHVSRIVWIDEL